MTTTTEQTLNLLKLAQEALQEVSNLESRVKWAKEEEEKYRKWWLEEATKVTQLEARIAEMEINPVIIPEMEARN